LTHQHEHRASFTPADPAALEEATRKYQALMNNEPYVPPKLREALKAALARKTAATRALAAAAADVVRKQAILAEHGNRLEAAEAAISNNDDIGSARDLAEERRVAEAQLTAAQNMLRKSTSAQALAQAEAQAAEGRVRQLKQSIHQAHLDDRLVARLNALRAEERDSGDTRGHDWTTHLVMLAVDAQVPMSQASKAIVQPESVAIRLF
jgi:hypothetical protein